MAVSLEYCIPMANHGIGQLWFEISSAYGFFARPFCIRCVLEHVCGSRLRESLDLCYFFKKASKEAGTW